MFIQYGFFDKPQRIKRLYFRIIHKHPFYKHIIVNRLFVQLFLGDRDNTRQTTHVNIVVGRNIQPSVIYIIQGKITLSVIVLECSRCQIEFRETTIGCHIDRTIQRTLHQSGYKSIFQSLFRSVSHKRICLLIK